ncbi:hypothetical protein [Paenibacillus ehimensis]|uniref:Phosphatase n=1 Tax=Paenibacillus ehimensis TaxID=79264 RepID=A0ABT8V3Y4_9BACL|nr:hypothetical protein [Paenibacillus ehimensis]MDO3676138.1 hypothetical protein [Paenibacillus ehimensis]
MKKLVLLVAVALFFVGFTIPSDVTKNHPITIVQLSEPDPGH